MTALTQLAELARQDNRAAQIFLARVAVHGHLHKHYTGLLPRTERVALLRQPGGLSGKSWLKAAQVDVPLAVALQQAGQTGSKAEALRALVEMEEMSEALRNIPGLITLGQAEDALAVLKDARSLPSDASVLIEWTLRERHREQAVYGSARMPLEWRLPETENDVAARLSWAPVPPRTFFEDSGLQKSVLENAKHVSSWKPLLTFCQTQCGRSVDQCTALGSTLLSLAPYHPFSSPLENLLPNTVYWASPRMEADVARRLPDLTEYGPWLHDFDACFVDTMTAVQARVR